MTQVIMAFICFAVYILIYYLVGVATTKILKLNNEPILQILYGMFVYSIIFFVYVMPLKFKLVPVSTIGVIWAVFVSVLCLTIIVLLRKYIISGLKKCMERIHTNNITILPAAIFTIFFITFIEVYGRVPNGFNQVWFVGWPANSVLHNELMTYDTSSGLPLTQFDNNRYLSTFLDHSAVVCKLTGMHVMVEVRTVLTAVFTLMQSIIVWKLANYFGKDDKKKVLLTFFGYWTFRNMLVGCQLLPGYYTIFRTYEGKGMVMNVCFPLLALIMWKMYDTPEDKGWIPKSVITLAGAMTYSLSMMFSAPFMLLAYIPFIISKKDKRLVRNLAILFAVAGAYVVIYYLGRNGTIDLTIHRGD